jgi:hypothetical protein
MRVAFPVRDAHKLLAPLSPVILGLVPRTAVSTKLPLQGARGVDEPRTANDIAAARGVLGTSPRMTAAGGVAGVGGAA